MASDRVVRSKPSLTTIEKLRAAVAMGNYVESRWEDRPEAEAVQP